MTYLLLLIIYIGFIGLGLPDSLFGAAWPAIYDEFGLPLSMGSVITIITTLGTTLSSMKSAVVIKRFGTGKVAVLSTLLTAIAILGISLTGSFWFICLCAIPLGLGAGSIDTALNNYVSQHYTASQMSFLHCFYGIGVTVSPLLLAHAMEGDGGWRGGYASAFWLQAGITVAVAALFLIGLGNGPMFPNFTYLTPQHFGNERSAAIIGTQLAVSNIAWLLMPVICSLLGEAFGMGVFPWYLALLYALLVWGIMRFGKR